MLARYLRTSQARPVRYALPHQFPPDLSEAIRNYLMLSLRGANVPHLHHQAQGVLQPFYQEHPAAQGAMQGLLGQQPHPSDMIALLDMIGEHGDQHGMPQLTPDVLMDAAHAAQQGVGGYPPHFQLLGHLHNLSRPLTGDLMSPQSPVRAFDSRGMSTLAPLLRAIGLTTDARAVHNLAGGMHHHLRHTESERDTMSRLGSPIWSTITDMINHGHPHAPARLYDLASQVLSETRNSPNVYLPRIAESTRDAAANLIHRRLIPHLYENQP